MFFYYFLQFTFFNYGSSRIIWIAEPDYFVIFLNLIQRFNVPYVVPEQ